MVTQTDDEALESLAPHGGITHVFNVLTDDRLECGIGLLGAVAAAGARLEGLRIAARGAALEHRLEIRGLKASQARRLSDQLAGLKGVSFSSVEHRLGRDRP